MNTLRRVFLATVATDDEIDARAFRMLSPAETLAAVVFPAGYLAHGPRRDQVRMAGNAVTPPAARPLGDQVPAALGTS